LGEGWGRGGKTSRILLSTWHRVQISLRRGEVKTIDTPFHHAVSDSEQRIVTRPVGDSFKNDS